MYRSYTKYLDIITQMCDHENFFGPEVVDGVNDLVKLK